MTGYTKTTSDALAFHTIYLQHHEVSQNARILRLSSCTFDIFAFPKDDTGFNKEINNITSRFTIVIAIAALLCLITAVRQ